MVGGHFVHLGGRKTKEKIPPVAVVTADRAFTGPISPTGFGRKDVRCATFNFQLSTFNFQLSTFNFQLSTFTCLSLDQQWTGRRS